MKKSEYKLLSFGTTVRNPERYKDFIPHILPFKDKVLTNSIIDKIVFSMIKYGEYCPMYINRQKKLKAKKQKNEHFTDKEVIDIIKNSPQKHKEAGFDRGWASRFDTWFNLAKELGLVYYEMGKKIEISPLGEKLANTRDMGLEKSIFLNAFVKYHRINPSRRTLNDNLPLILLLRVIKLLNKDDTLSNAGITKKEISLLISWKDNNAQSLYKTIKILRSKHGYNPSNEVILNLCDKILGGRHASNKDHTVLVEYPDDFIRKMRLTGLISIRGMGKFIDINHNEDDKIEYIIKHYNHIYRFSSEKNYFDYMAKIDDNLIKNTVKLPSSRDAYRMLVNLSNTYSYNTIKKELDIVSSKNKKSQHPVLKYLSNPLRLEFLTALGVVIKCPNVFVKPNYLVDDEGMPCSHAPGNNPDIECIDQGNHILLEVTLLRNADQVPREGPPIERHLENYIEQHKKQAVTYFIAPNIHGDMQKYADFLHFKSKQKLTIIHFTISDFVAKIENDRCLITVN